MSSPARGRKSPAARRRNAEEQNRPLVEDIRLLGRILGDVIREQEGRKAFDLIERVRQLSVAYRLKKDASAGRALSRLLKGLFDSYYGNHEEEVIFDTNRAWTANAFTW